MKDSKRLLCILMVLVMVMFTVSCGGNETEGEPAEDQTVQEETEEAAETAEEASQETDEAAAETDDAGKSVVVYFSRVGNTEFPEGTDAVSSASLIAEDGQLKGNAQKIAEIIAEKEGAELFEIQVTEPYPVDYNETVNQASDEQNEDARPELASTFEGLDGYSTVYLVFPNWWGDLPMAVYSFFDEYDFSGKTINVFATHEGSRFSGTVGTVADLEPEATVNEGLAIRGSDVPGSAEEITAWLDENR